MKGIALLADFLLENDVNIGPQKSKNFGCQLFLMDMYDASSSYRITIKLILIQTAPIGYSLRGYLKKGDGLVSK